MSASLIATNITFDEVFGSLLVGASIILTSHSLSRMIFLRRTGSKYHLFPIINVSQFINQWCVFLLICTAFNTISLKTALWLNVFAWIHYFFIGFRALELFVIVIVNIIQNELCDGSVAKGTRCEKYAIAWTFRDAGAPVFRFYYILCEGIFYYKLFATLKSMSVGKNLKLIQYRRLQTSLFTVDLILLIFMSIYRIIGIFNKALPTYVYYELFSSTLTIFNLTEFGLNIRMLFGTVISDKSGENGSNSGSSPSKLEMGSMHRSSRSQAQTPVPETRRHNSTSPLTSFAAEAAKPPTAISFSNNTNNNDNNTSRTYPEEWSRSASPVPQQQADKYILAPSSFQSQERSGFYDEVGQRQDIVAKPNRAALPERSARR
ncbi:hypothetical protein BGZ93_009105 [Podila epicladia]|nr:hypothetical protein BGZ93_009105 [Podila epicladia]